MVLKGTGWVSADKSTPQWCTEADPAATCMNPRGIAIWFKSKSHQHITYSVCCNMDAIDGHQHAGCWSSPRTSTFAKDSPHVLRLCWLEQLDRTRRKLCTRGIRKHCKQHSKCGKVSEGKLSHLLFICIIIFCKVCETKIHLPVAWNNPGRRNRGWLDFL